METLQTTSTRNLFPEEIYDLLFKAKLLGEGKVIINNQVENIINYPSSSTNRVTT